MILYHAHPHKDFCQMKADELREYVQRWDIDTRGLKKKDLVKICEKLSRDGNFMNGYSNNKQWRNCVKIPNCDFVYWLDGSFSIEKRYKIGYRYCEYGYARFEANHEFQKLKVTVKDWPYRSISCDEMFEKI